VRWFESDHVGSPAPFVWDEARWAQLWAQLDALPGHLYGLTRKELAYILDTFPMLRLILPAHDGEYRTKRMVLQQHEGLRGQFA